MPFLRPLIAAAVLLAGAPAGAQVAPADLQKTYDQLCTGAAQASAATCAALKADVAKTQAGASARQPAAVHAAPTEWAGLDLLVGTTFVKRKGIAGTLASDTSETRTFRRTGPDTIVADVVIESQSPISIPYTIDPATGLPAGQMLENGALVSIGAPDAKFRTTLRVLGPDRFETTVEELKGGRWKVMMMGRTTYESTGALQTRRAERDAALGQLAQGALTISQAYADGQREVAEQQAALNRAAAEDRARNEAAAREAQAAADAKKTADANARQQAESQRLADQQRLAEQQKLEQKRLADQKAADARKAAEQQRLAELKRQEEAKKQPVAFKEGVVLCRQQKINYWRCDGPLQFDYGDINAPAGQVTLKNACGGDLGIHDLGTTGGYRAFGCGFGIHPTARDYPGNRDVPAEFGVYVADRGTYYCPASKLAYCRG